MFPIHGNACLRTDVDRELDCRQAARNEDVLRSVLRSARCVSASYSALEANGAAFSGWKAAQSAHIRWDLAINPPSGVRKTFKPKSGHSTDTAFVSCNDPSRLFVSRAYGLVDTRKCGKRKDASIVYML